MLPWRETGGEVRDRHTEESTVLPATHGYFSQHLIRARLGIDSMTGWFDVHNTSLTLLEEDAGETWSGVTVRRLDWMPHLSGEQVTT